MATTVEHIDEYSFVFVAIAIFVVGLAAIMCGAYATRSVAQ